MCTCFLLVNGDLREKQVVPWPVFGDLSCSKGNLDNLDLLVYFLKNTLIAENFLKIKLVI